MKLLLAHSLPVLQTKGGDHLISSISIALFELVTQTSLVGDSEQVFLDELCSGSAFTPLAEKEVSVLYLPQEAERMKVIVVIMRDHGKHQIICVAKTWLSAWRWIAFFLSFLFSILFMFFTFSFSCFFSLCPPSILVLFSPSFLFCFLISFYSFPACLVLSLLISINLLFCSCWESTGLVFIYSTIFKRVFSRSAAWCFYWLPSFTGGWHGSLLSFF